MGFMNFSSLLQRVQKSFLSFAFVALTILWKNRVFFVNLCDVILFPCKFLFFVLVQTLKQRRNKRGEIANLTSLALGISLSLKLTKMYHLIFYAEEKNQKFIQMLIFPIFVFSRQKCAVILCSSFCSYY